MKFVVNSIFLLVLSSFIVTQSYANSALLNHAQALENVSLFQIQSPQLGKEWIGRWLALTDKLKIEYSAEYDWDVDRLQSKVVSERFKARLAKLAQHADSVTSKRMLAAKEKWMLVENSAVNYSDQSAYFLVYATNNKIAKELESAHSILAASNI